MRCLEKRPQARYASAKDLARDLARYLRGQEVLGQQVRRSEAAKSSATSPWVLVVLGDRFLLHAKPVG